MEMNALDIRRTCSLTAGSEVRIRCSAATNSRGHNLAIMVGMLSAFEWPADRGSPVDVGH